jgi:phosphatidylglycerophosphate synthase
MEGRNGAFMGFDASKSKEADEWLAKVYIRPIANILILQLKNTRLHSLHITALALFCGLCASYLIYLDKFLYFFWAAILIQLKSILDAVDGGLARVKQEYSDIGRFGDSIADFITDLFLFVSIYVISIKYENINTLSVLFVLAFLIANLTCSFWVYYFNLYLSKSKNGYYQTKDKNKEPIYPFDLKYPKYFYLTKKLYAILYGWQDHLIAKLDNLLIRNKSQNKINLKFVKFTGIFGIGTRLLILSICLILGEPLLFFSILIFIYLPLWIFLILSRYRSIL